MKETVFISLPIEDFQTVIMDCVNSCLRNNKLDQNSSISISDEWFDLNELCVYHPDKPARQTVYGWVNSGLIPVHKSGKKLRFLKSEIDQWLRKGKKKTFEEIKKDAEAFTKSK